MPLPLGRALYESGGAQGLVGIALFMGGETTPSRAVVQSAGDGYRIKAAALKKNRGGGCAPRPESAVVARTSKGSAPEKVYAPLNA